MQNLLLDTSNPVIKESFDCFAGLIGMMIDAIHMLMVFNIHKPTYLQVMHKQFESMTHTSE